MCIKSKENEIASKVEFAENLKEIEIHQYFIWELAHKPFIRLSIASARSMGSVHSYNYIQVINHLSCAQYCCTDENLFTMPAYILVIILTDLVAWNNGNIITFT